MNRNPSSMNGSVYSALLVALLTGCQPTDTANGPASNPAGVIHSNAALATPALVDSYRLVLAPQTGDSPLDKQIAQAQEAVRLGATHFLAQDSQTNRLTPHPGPLPFEGRGSATNDLANGMALPAFDASAVTPSPVNGERAGVRGEIVTRRALQETEMRPVRSGHGQVTAREYARPTVGETALERLGWLFVAKARASFDDSFYKLAEQCALCLDSRQPGDAGAMLLRGHVLHNLHRFKEAEPLARHLASTRGAPFDHGLLGDVLMEIGQINEAATAYQRMMDLRPDSRALARAAHLRWLKGDLAGAVVAMQEAARSVSPRDAESAAWMHTRLGFYHLASGEAALAEEACAAAMRLQSNYAPALLLQGRAHLAVGEGAEAVEPLQRAVRSNPLPEYQWALAEALFESGRFDEARAMHAELRKHGAERDPRTFALYLATRREEVELALSLARHELTQRADVFTHDALAWCLARAEQLDEASLHMEKALAEGTNDGRLFFHAAVIAAKSGRVDDARRFRAQAERLAQLLLPSERLQLQTAAPGLESKQAKAAESLPQVAQPIVFTSGH